MAAESNLKRVEVAGTQFMKSHEQVQTAETDLQTKSLPILERLAAHCCAQVPQGYEVMVIDPAVSSSCYIVTTGEIWRAPKNIRQRRSLVVSLTPLANVRNDPAIEQVRSSLVWNIESFLGGFEKALAKGAETNQARVHAINEAISRAEQALR